MSGGGQAGAVEKVGVGHAQLGRTLVHAGDEGLLAARQMLRQGHGGVVGGDHSDTLQQLPHGELLPLLQIDLRAAHARGVGGDGDRLIPADQAGVQGLEQQQQGHDLGDAGGLVLGVGVFFIEDDAGVPLHEQGGVGGQLAGEGGGGGVDGGGEQGCGKQQDAKAFHRGPSCKDTPGGGIRSDIFRMTGRPPFYAGGAGGIFCRRGRKKERTEKLPGVN